MMQGVFYGLLVYCFPLGSFISSLFILSSQRNTTELKKEDSAEKLELNSYQ